MSPHHSPALRQTRAQEAASQLSLARLQCLSSPVFRGEYSLRNQSTNDPDRIEKALTEAFEELQAIQQELQVREQYEITKAEQAEETLWQSKERFRVLTRNLGSGVVLMDPSGKIAEYNSAFLKMFDLADDPSRNMLVNVRMPANGDLIWMLISAEPIIKPDGEIDSLICTCQDVTRHGRLYQQTHKARRVGRGLEQVPEEMSSA